MEFDLIFENIKKRALQNAAIGDTVKFAIGQNTIYVDGRGDQNLVSQEDDTASCTLTISPENMSKIMKGELDPMMATMMGKLKISGDMGLAMKLQSLI